MTTKVNFDNAKDHLPELINRAMNGEEVLISGEGKSVVKLVPVVITKKQKG